MTGNVGVPGAGVNPLRGQNNVQGCATMGCEPDRLTGSQKLEAARATHEHEWGAALPTRPGLTLPEMIEAADAGRLKALVVVGYDILLTMPNADATARALGKLDALIVLDLFFTETARAAGTVFLPVASSFEKDGTFMNSERRIQRVRQALPRRGECKTDGEVLSLLAQRLGGGDGFRHADARAVWDEVRRLWPAAAGISYERIESRGLQWPCPSEDHAGTELLHADRFAIGPRARFHAIDYRASEEQPTPDLPFVLVTGRQLHHFNAATMTDRTANRELRPNDLGAAPSRRCEPAGRARARANPHSQPPRQLRGTRDADARGSPGRAVRDLPPRRRDDQPRHRRRLRPRDADSRVQGDGRGARSVVARRLSASRPNLRPLPTRTWCSKCEIAE